MNKKNIFLTNIQRFSLHDGPGIRTTVFLKGCGLRCPWCANPENLYGHEEKFFDAESLAHELLKDKIFYQSDPPGGVTFSGGEALLQAENLVPVFEIMKREKIHMTVETCLYVPEKNLRLAIEYIDLFFVDVKILERDSAARVLQGNLDLYLKNFELLANKRPIIIRVPVIGGFTDCEENRALIKNFLARYKNAISKIELLKEHNLGAAKYKKLGLPVPDYKGVSDELMQKYFQELSDLNLPLEILRV